VLFVWLLLVLLLVYVVVSDAFNMFFSCCMFCVCFFVGPMFVCSFVHVVLFWFVLRS